MAYYLVMSTSDRISRRGLFSIIGGQKRVAAAGGVSGLDPLAARADRLFRQDEFTQAETLYAEMIEREPEHLEAYRRRGICLMRAENYAEAHECWESLLAIAPDDPGALLYQGLTHARQESVDSALALWQRYRNFQQVELQREINLILALAEDGRLPETLEIVARIEAALANSNSK